MKALVLAAGVGRRMRPLTDSTHKTLLPIAGTTVLDRLLTSLRDCGVGQVCIVTGYRADELRQAVDERFADLDVQYVHNPDYDTTNNVYSMALALEHMQLDDDLVLIESDLIVDHRVIEQIVNTPYPNAALVDHYRIGMDGTVVSIGPDNAISQVYPSYMQDDNFDLFDKYKTLNIYKFDRDFASTTFRQLLSFYARAIDANCYYELLLGVLIYMRAAKVYAELVEHPWAEVDDPNDLAAAEFEFNVPARRQVLEGSWGGSWGLSFTDFYFIRNMYFPTPGLLAQLRGSLAHVSGHYGSGQAVLNAKMAYFERCDERRIFLLNGASQAYPVLASLFAGARALVPAPTFGEYARVFPGASTYPDLGSVDLGEIGERLDGVEILVVVNPNNPTGTVVPTAGVIDLARAHPSKTFLVDESFIDFSDQPSVLGALEAEPMPNVVVLKSLSKCWGVPGLRLGYVYTTSAEVMAALWSANAIWNVNSVAEHFLELVLKHRDALAASYHQTVLDRERFARDLAGLPVVSRVFPSGADFVLVELDMPAAEAAALADRLLAERRLHVKDASGRFDGGRGYFRLAVRRPEDNDELCRALPALAGGAADPSGAGPSAARHGAGEQGGLVEGTGLVAASRG
jgi:histidinol-phosphate/aromatic aminotransferase/cobyric acid decarboxylase-like protein/GTP:adenosylcobinamide-phosphate guanylyltransferase